MMTSNIISIVVPTYKEAENIPLLLQEVDAAMGGAGLLYEVILVDDNSGDGIIEAVEKLKERYNVKLKVREDERGLSSAVLAGIGLASGGILVVMDADLSHPPRYLPELVKPVLNGTFDFVIGSRFVPGGSAVDFNWYRRLNAWISRMLALPLTPVADPMAGFFAFRRGILETGGELNPLGFKIGLEILVKASPRRVLEIPIQFEKRQFGSSKLSLKEQVYYLIHLGRLLEYKYLTIAQFIKFCLVGGSGMLVDLTFVYGSMNALPLWTTIPQNLHFKISRAIGFSFALTSNYLLNRQFTFTSAGRVNFYGQYMTYFAVSIAGLAVNWLVSVLMYESSYFFHRHYLIASFLGIVGGTLINFFGSKYIVFQEKG